MRIVFATLLAALWLPLSLPADDLVPAARWDFGAEEATPLTAHGGVQRDQAGPRAPEFPDFAENNTAVRLDGKGAYLSIDDSGPASRFDFTNGDSITLEAFVQVDDIRDGQPRYVIGKGRTNSPQFARDNQNWALRVVGSKGEIRLSFLFATAPAANGAHWHRWTSRLAFGAATGWHHIAVAYRFGQPESIRGWIDGRPTDGGWDMGGATKDAPVVDDDAIWIGSSLGGNAANSFNGWIDAVAIHRAALDDKVISSRFQRVGGPRTTTPLPEVMPDLTDVPAGRVLVTFHEGLPTHERWLNEGEAWPKEAARWEGHEFLLPRIPLRYDEWGIRASWTAPLLVRIAADVELPPGKQRFLLRARALSRLWIDGVVVARTEAALKRPPDGEEALTPVAQPPLPGLRAQGYRQQEVFGEALIPTMAEGRPRRCRVVLEIVAGGQNMRTETGEVCVAMQTDGGKSFTVLCPAEPALPMTDVAVRTALSRIEASLAENDDQVRRRAAASQDGFWQRRHDMAREWLRQQPAPPVPAVEDAPAGQPVAVHPVDALIASKIKRLLRDAAQSDPREAARFHEKVLPVLRERCFRCHGEKEKGGLKLNSREGLLKSGDSELAAVVPGDPAGSELITRIESDDENVRMPPTGTRLTAEHVSLLKEWIKSGAKWPAPPVSESEVAMAPVVGDEAFLRRIYLDTLGVPPTAEEARAFLADTATSKRQRLIDRLLTDGRFADHWMSFWLDLLAENPSLLNASLNSTGPFRWFLYEALRDGKALDRMVTELMMMRGSPHEGGSAGFSIAAENDAPFAAKGHILASAFLGIDLQCARCHDSPYHSTTQRDLFSLAALLERKPLTVPVTSRVPAAFFEKKARASLIRVTLKPDETVLPAWPFAEVSGVADDASIDRLMQNPRDSRERFAALITAPQNKRFSRVIVNRVWKQLLGAGIVEPVHDWEGAEPSHPELLDWLARTLVEHDYDLRQVIRTIVSSQLYQRAASGRNLAASPALRVFNAPERRRLTAEQVVDSLHAATGSPMDVEELTFVHDGRRPFSNRLTLGRPKRAWMFATLNNERDRPSLSLPRARTVADVLEAFGWTGSRQKPITQRELDPNVLQPGVLSNGALTMTLTRASAGSALAQLAVDADSPAALVETLFLRVLSRYPLPEERAVFSSALAAKFDERLVAASSATQLPELPELPLVTWFNHLNPEATTVQNERERRVLRGPPPDPRLDPEWREVYEDLIWSLFNQREFVWLP